jgi:hypothetical protein
MLGAEKGNERHSGRPGEKLDRGAPAAVHAGLVGNQADTPPAQERKVLLGEHVQACKDRARPFSLCGFARDDEAQQDQKDPRQCMR